MRNTNSARNQQRMNAARRARNTARGTGGVMRRGTAAGARSY